MGPESRIIVSLAGVAREVSLKGKVLGDEQRELSKFFTALGQRAPLDTGLLPPGVVSYRQAGDHAQLVLVVPPGVNLINWGAFERDPKAATWQLAQPYRVIIGDMLNGNLLGCRMFYSPDPISSVDQPLYHQNVPNINCKGYRDTSVGWVCLYHHEDWSKLNLAAKALRMQERCSGVETFNDANMSGTDGPRFYAERGAPDFLTNPAVWEKKSQKEGFEWALDPALWVPVKVKGRNEQNRHVDNGVPLTLEMAMYGNAVCYYGDAYQPKLGNALHQGEVAPEVLFAKVFNEAFAQAAPVDPNAPKPKVVVINQGKAVPVAFDAQLNQAIKGVTFTCASCGELVANAEKSDFAWNHKPLCKDCEKYFTNCGQCGQMVKAEAGAAHQFDDGWYCIGHEPQFACLICEQEFPATKMDQVNGFKVCFDCFADVRICMLCGLTAAEYHFITTNEGETLCRMCVKLCGTCERPYSKATEGDHCADCFVPPQAVAVAPVAMAG